MAANKNDSSFIPPTIHLDASDKVARRLLPRMVFGALLDGRPIGRPTAKRKPKSMPQGLSSNHKFHSLYIKIPAAGAADLTAWNLEKKNSPFQ